MDREINRFQDRIRFLEDEKRKLNIKFKPFDLKYSPIRRMKTDFTEESIIKHQNSKTFCGKFKENERK